jgi:ferrochelatase
MVDTVPSQSRTGILLLAYGTPESLDQVEAYYTHIRGGRPPSAAALANLVDRYKAVGGSTQLAAHTENVASGLRALLKQRGIASPVYVGMKHWHPWISDVVATMKADRIERVIGIVLAPHYSRFSVGGYQRYLFEGMAKHDAHFDVQFVEQWYAQPRFVELLAQRVTDALSKFSPESRTDVVTLFSAHSLPERIRTWDDPYERQLADSARLVAERVGISDYRFVWQSAGDTGEPWIGPDVLDYLETLQAEGVKHVVQVPIGFVSEHLEIVYDLDVEAESKARELGIEYRRTRLPNADADFLELMADLCESALRGDNVVSVDAPPPSTRRPDELAAAARVQPGRPQDVRSGASA